MHILHTSTTPPWSTWSLSNPNAAACFISDLFERSIDDVTLFKQCGIMNCINCGDSLLVDKGLTIQNLVLVQQAGVFIPPFLGKWDSCTKEEDILTKRRGKAHIYVERFNERLKNLDYWIEQYHCLLYYSLPNCVCCCMSCKLSGVFMKIANKSWHFLTWFFVKLSKLNNISLQFTTLFFARTSEQPPGRHNLLIAWPAS